MNSSLEFDLDVLRNHPWVDEVVFAKEMTSTNDVAIELKNSPVGTTLILTEQQTAGRGRGHNRWESSKGALTYSLRLSRSPNIEFGIPLLALTVGLAISNSTNELVRQDLAKIKWPNDVLLAGKKLTGVLIESNPHSIVIGIGTNVSNNPLESATRLNQHADRQLSLQEVITSQLDHLSRLVPRMVETKETILDECSRALIHRDMEVSLTMPDGDRITGLNSGIGTNGELLIQQNGRTIEVVSASEIRW